MPYDRRTLLFTTSLAVAAVGLSSCRASGPTEPDPSAEALSMPLAEVPVGGGVILTDDPYVVTQPTAGEVKAFSNVCTHQHCPLSRVDGSEIICDCHGSRFSISDGSVTNGPARDPLPSYPARVEGDTVHVN